MLGPGALVVGFAAAGVGVGAAINQIPAVQRGTTDFFEFVLDNTVSLAENNRHRQNRVNGLI